MLRTVQLYVHTRLLPLQARGLFYVPESRTWLPSGPAQGRGLCPLQLSLLVSVSAADRQQRAQTRLEGLGTYRYPSQLNRQCEVQGMG
ncbi:hypothetical protein GGI43DRAFT_390579 [Trichoderma evansii]